MAYSTIFDHREDWKGWMIASGILHGALFGGMIGYQIYLGARGENWGGTQSGGGAMSATLVSSAIPLPSTEAPKENVLATESKGLSESQPKEEVIEPEAIPIPDRTTKTKPEKTPSAQPNKPRNEPPKDNVIPYGEGGPVSGPFTTMKTDTGAGGMQFGAGGSFGSRYAWYVDAVRRKVSENWLKYEVDPNIRSANRVFLTFDIGRTGQPTNVQVLQSSGVPSLDQSAVRALQRIDTFGPLPPDYSGSRVSVEFWFDYKR